MRKLVTLFQHAFKVYFGIIINYYGKLNFPDYGLDHKQQDVLLWLQLVELIIFPRRKIDYTILHQVNNMHCTQ